MASNGSGSGTGAIVPTNSVSANGSNIKARIDPTLSVAEVCINHVIFN